MKQLNLHLLMFKSKHSHVSGVLEILLIIVYHPATSLISQIIQIVGSVGATNFAPI